MLNNPLLTRAISCILLGLGLYLALENTLISANVLQFSIWCNDSDGVWCSGASDWFRTGFC